MRIVGTFNYAMFKFSGFQMLKQRKLQTVIDL
ncbi:uncharacterized protein METZ01_LOCUS446199 [marine metagenome]|uniref:Uncharacterized protein n=1 Tax=marine metagenome TaxID=408172 RepID=A0A382ZE39_9ZZZZ